MTRISFDCDRCKKDVNGLITPGYTAGFYNVADGMAWEAYRLDEHEHFVCDECVQSMPEYKTAYGI